MSWPFPSTPTPPEALDFRRIPAFDEARACTSAGTALAAARRAAPAFREAVQESGTADLVRTCPLVRLPYPAAFGFFRAAVSPAPFLLMTNRVVVVRFRDLAGTPRVLLFDPTCADLAANTPFFRDLARKTPKFLQDLLVRPYPGVLDHLARLGIAPEEVDYISFDHLHTQDLRRLLGTTRPQADLSPDAPLRPALPRARLLVQKAELDLVAHMHPVQAPWYQPGTFTDLPPASIVALDGDVLLGSGVALMATPGHTAGNHSLVLHTSSGLWTLSENAVAAECLSPEHSRIPGLRRRAAAMGWEVVLNGNTLEATAQQYNSVVMEKLVADPSPRDPRFVQFFPTSELTAHPLAPGLAPTFSHGEIRHGAPATDGDTATRSQVAS